MNANRREPWPSTYTQGRLIHFSQASRIASKAARTSSIWYVCSREIFPKIFPNRIHPTCFHAMLTNPNSFIRYVPLHKISGTARLAIGQLDIHHLEYPLAKRRTFELPVGSRAQRLGGYPIWVKIRTILSHWHGWSHCPRTLDRQSVSTSLTQCT